MSNDDTGNTVIDALKGSTPETNAGVPNQNSTRPDDPYDGNVFLEAAWGRAVSKDAPKVTPETAIPLDQVLKEVSAAIAKYHADLGQGKDMLLPLVKVDIDFKTTIDATAGFSINVLIFKFGVSVQRESLSDICFSYTVPPPKGDLANLSSAAEDRSPRPLKSGLEGAIEEAAKAVKAANATAGDLGWTNSANSATVQFSVKWDGNASASIPIQLVTIGPNVDVSKTCVHSAKLTFGKVT